MQVYAPALDKVRLEVINILLYLLHILTVKIRIIDKPRCSQLYVINYSIKNDNVIRYVW